MLRAILHKVTIVLDAILKIRNCSMMTSWHHSDSSKARSAEHESVKKKTLYLSFRSKWFSAGLYFLFFATLIFSFFHRNEAILLDFLFFLKLIS